MIELVLALQTPVITVQDVLGNDVSQGFELVDWPNYMANPAIRLIVSVPPHVREVSVAGSDAKLMFSRSNPTDFFGVAARYHPDATGKFTFDLAAVPDRDGRSDSTRLMLDLLNDQRISIGRQEVIVNIRDLDRPINPRFRIDLDFGFDKTGWMRKRVVQSVIRQAAVDWASFIDRTSFQTLAIGTETAQYWGPDGFVNSLDAKNRTRIPGYWLIATGMVHPPLRAGGAPSRFADARTLPRSGSIEFDIRGNYNGLGWSVQNTDESWWHSGCFRDEPHDLYSIALHEMGHALAFHPQVPGFRPYFQKQSFDSEPLIRYVGSAVAINQDSHLQAIDPATGVGTFGYEYQSRLKLRRWLLTPLHLLALREIGWPLLPHPALQPVHIASQPRWNLRLGKNFNKRLYTSDFVMARWSVLDGKLPSGLRFDTKSGLIRGSPNESGSGEFTVRAHSLRRDQPEIDPVKIYWSVR